MKEETCGSYHQKLYANTCGTVFHLAMQQNFGNIEGFVEYRAVFKVVSRRGGEVASIVQAHSSGNMYLSCSWI